MPMIASRFVGQATLDAMRASTVPELHAFIASHADYSGLVAAANAELASRKAVRS